MSKHKKRDTVPAAKAEEEARPRETAATPEEEARPEAGETAREATAAEWREKYLRVLAELDNYRKRMERERQQSRLFALEDLMRALLPVLDHLQLASGAKGDADKIREGVALALKDALRVLGEQGLKVIEALDLPFDPRFHEAMATIPDAKRQAGTVIDELCRGYALHERVLRPAKVHVAVEPPKTEEAEDAEASQPNNEE
ncbi:MAG: nucleotide exchange factor GrpE [Planctomycetota bacterium]|jgi:molecular chaperone GrpE